MKKIFFYLWILLIMSVCSYNLTIHYIPNIVYTVFHYKIEKNENSGPTIEERKKSLEEKKKKILEARKAKLDAKKISKDSTFTNN